MKGGEAAGTVLEIRVRVCTVVTVYVQYTETQSKLICLTCFIQKVLYIVHSIHLKVKE